MLDSITIQNFKAIQNEPLILDNLAQVNYLVGPNGCGKSSVLEGVYKYVLQEIKVKIPSFVEKLDNIDGYDNISINNKQKDITSQINDYYYRPLFIGHNSQFIAEFCLEQNGLDIKGVFERLLNEYFYVEWSLALEVLITSEEDKKMSQGEIQKKVLEKIIEQYAKLSDQEDGYAREFANNDDFTPEKVPNLIFIEEPEHFLHPNWQKQIVNILGCWSSRVGIVGSYNDKNEKHLPVAGFADENGSFPYGGELDIKKDQIQFFISTHSPFIVSAAGKMEEDRFEQEFLDYKKNKSSEYKTLKNNNGKDELQAKNYWRKNIYKPSQKVYQIEKGTCKNPLGNWGYDMVVESAVMLGAGLEDVLGKHKSPTENQSFLVYCEGGDGKGTLKDADIFNQLAKLWPENVLFIGCGSYLDVANQAMTAKEFYSTQRGNVQILGILDEDQASKYLDRKDLKTLGYWDLERFILQDKEDKNQKNKTIIKKAEGIWKKNKNDENYLKMLSDQLHSCIFGNK
jgi:hypothetical protein